MPNHYKQLLSAMEMVVILFDQLDFMNINHKRLKYYTWLMIIDYLIQVK